MDVPVKSNHAYLAGILDGEGSISVQRQRSGKRMLVYHKLLVRVCNTDYRLMAWLKASYGGSVRSERRSADRKVIYHWTVSGVAATRALAGIEPHLIIKRERALTALALGRLIGPRSGTVSDGLRAERERLSALIATR